MLEAVIPRIRCKPTAVAPRVDGAACAALLSERCDYDPGVASSRVALCVLLLVAGCAERALGLGGDVVGSDPDGALTSDGGAPEQLHPPGSLPQVYCERIVTLSDTGQLALFDPVALAFSDTARLDCPAMGGAGPYSIALDAEGRLWAEYSSGELFLADAESGSCKPSGLGARPASFHSFDMTFAPDPTTQAEALFVSSVADAGKARLGEIDPGTLMLRDLAPMKANAELTTFNGELWGMFRGSNPHAARIDRTTAALGPDVPVALGDITGDGLAFSSFAGSFYVFLLPHNSSTAVFRMATDGGLSKVLDKTGRRVISATIAVCR
jgi:hypothetical protein